MSRIKQSLLTGATIAAAAFAMTVGGTGLASASPQVGQSQGSCTYTIDVFPVGGVDRDAYGNVHFINIGRNDNSGVNCRYNIEIKFRVKATGATFVATHSGHSLNDVQEVDGGGLRTFQAGLQVCTDSGCSPWAYSTIDRNR
ncbi:hypothetical protein F3087_21905 [Nocardia colli]|uniref:Spore-associated protein A n=1 Tax=Nocardia colli TaxID=2545717 RepID=A0A5N0ED67_9NOCA|nr:hypothetical protein [Nocardia colli]KAA8886873.1 hypothetical protein F3087_21905 [Nocardia colli]